MSVKRPKSLRAARGIALALSAASVWGAESRAEPTASADTSSNTETIIVTGERADANPYADPRAPFKVDRSASGKFTETIQNTPKSITVLPKEAIEALGAFSFRDVARTQPGVTLGTGEGGNAFGDRIFVRGFDTRNDVYIDGVRDPGVGTRETFAVEQIEIVKGPSSTFGGRGTTGGAVSLVSKAPRPTSFSDLDLSVGTDDTRRIAVDLNRRLGDDVGVRVNAMSHSADVAGRDYAHSERWGLSAALAWTPSETLSLGADYYHLSTDALPDWGVPYDVRINAPFAVRRENYYGVLSRDFMKTFADVYTAKASYAFSPALTVSSTLRYGQSGNAYTASAPEQPNVTAGTVSANAKRRDSVTRYLVSQTDATLRTRLFGFDHTIVAGVELSNEETLNRLRAFTECAALPCTGAAANPVLNLYRPDPTIPFGSQTAVTSRPVIDTSTAALYALDTVKLNRFVEVFLGARYDDYDAETSGAPPNREAHSALFNFQTGIVLKPDERKTFYASYGSSTNPPCEQLDAFAIDYNGCDARVAALDPVENRSLELGAKWSLAGGHLLATAALFRIERKDVPVAVGSGSAAPVGSYDVAVDGVEFGASGNLTERLSLFGGLTVLSSEITRSAVAGQKGAQLPNVPETSFSLTAEYAATKDFSFGGTATYNGKKYGGTVAAGTTQIPEFWRLDVFGEYAFSARVKLALHVLNAGDELYYDAIYRSATPFVYMAPGRSALLSLDYYF